MAIIGFWEANVRCDELAQAPTPPHPYPSKREGLGEIACGQDMTVGDPTIPAKQGRLILLPHPKKRKKQKDVFGSRCAPPEFRCAHSLALRLTFFIQSLFSPMPHGFGRLGAVRQIFLRNKRRIKGQRRIGRRKQI